LASHANKSISASTRKRFASLLQLNTPGEKNIRMTANRLVKKPIAMAKDGIKRFAVASSNPPPTTIERLCTNLLIATPAYLGH